MTVGDGHCHGARSSSRWCLARQLLIMDNGAEEGGDEANTIPNNLSRHYRRRHLVHPQRVRVNRWSLFAYTGCAVSCPLESET